MKLELPVEPKLFSVEAANAIIADPNEPPWHKTPARECLRLDAEHQAAIAAKDLSRAEELSVELSDNWDLALNGHRTPDSGKCAFCKKEMPIIGSTSMLRFEDKSLKVALSHDHHADKPVIHPVHEACLDGVKGARELSFKRGGHGWKAE